LDNWAARDNKRLHVRMCEGIGNTTCLGVTIEVETAEMDPKLTHLDPSAGPVGPKMGQGFAKAVVYLGFGNPNHARRQVTPLAGNGVNRKGSNV